MRTLKIKDDLQNENKSQNNSELQRQVVQTTVGEGVRSKSECPNILHPYQGGHQSVKNCLCFFRASLGQFSVPPTPQNIVMIPFICHVSQMA